MKTIITLAVLLCAAVNGAEVKLAWDAAPVAQKVTEWHVYRVDGTTKTLLTKVTAPAATVTAEPGQTIAVAAWNGLESAPATITLPTPPSPPTGLRVVEIQTTIIQRP